MVGIGIIMFLPTHLYHECVYQYDSCLDDYMWIMFLLLVSLRTEHMAQCGDKILIETTDVSTDSGSLSYRQSHICSMVLYYVSTFARKITQFCRFFIYQHHGSHLGIRRQILESGTLHWHWPWPWPTCSVSVATGDQKFAILRDRPPLRPPDLHVWWVFIRPSDRQGLL